MPTRRNTAILSTASRKSSFPTCSVSPICCCTISTCRACSTTIRCTDDDCFDVILMNPPYGGNEKADIKSHFPDDLASSETADLFMAVILYRLKQNGRAAVILPDGFLFGTDNAKINIKKKLLKECNLHTVIRMPSSVFAL